VNKAVIGFSTRLDAETYGQLGARLWPSVLGQGWRSMPITCCCLVGTTAELG